MKHSVQELRARAVHLAQTMRGAGARPSSIIEALEKLEVRGILLAAVLRDAYNLTVEDAHQVQQYSLDHSKNRDEFDERLGQIWARESTK